MDKINGEYYPLWEQFVERKKEFVGGILESFENGEKITTEITDIILRPNGKDSAFFSVEGKDFGCGFDTRYGGISGTMDSGWIPFVGYGGHTWRIKDKNDGDGTI